MVQCSARVAVYGKYGLMWYATRDQAVALLLNSPNVKRITPGKKITDLMLEDFNPSDKNEDHRPSNSLKAGYMQTLSGGDSLTIETPTSSRQTTTQPCRAYKLKSIPSTLRALYRSAVLENLVSA